MSAVTSKPGVDTHFHVFEAHVGTPGARYVPAYDAPLAAWRSLANPLGVTRGVVVQPSFLGTDNALLLRQLREHPHDLRGIVVVAPDTPAQTLRAWHCQGVRGIRLNLSGLSHDLGAWAGATGLWDTLLELGWHVDILSDTGALPSVLAQLPGAMPVVLDHMARPAAATARDETVAAVATRARRSPVHVKLSGAYRLGDVDAGTLARLWAAETGPSSLLWGSDWPCTNHEAQSDYPRLLGALSVWLDPHTASAALRANPATLYWGE